MAKAYYFTLFKDPYCIIHIGGQKFQTKPDNGAGKKPKWVEYFTFQGNANELKIQVYDDDIGKDDFIGEATVSLNKWTSNPHKAESINVDIFEKNKKAGQVLISIEYQGPAIGGNQPNQGGLVNQPNQPNQGGLGNQQNNQTQSSGGYSNPGKLGYWSA